ncbi:nickel pincer cofactor biosynthesis protein LarB [Motilibacter aurantiacus]|uniref:nickel pincer cofactor biosynthesis protein LarB n=1 Tax=Motilibacter aurantiacus TaxID=2714955 RepID=UPI0038B323B7
MPILPPDTGFADLGFACVDTARAARTGDPEVVFAQGKRPHEVVAILRRLAEAHPDRAVLATRCQEEAVLACADSLGDRATIDRVAGTVVVGPLPAPVGRVAVVAAGTSDLDVARECLTTVRVHGAGADLVSDVGIAGLHRLLARLDDIRAADVVVAVAGMEGALPSVLGGLVATPLIALPTSVGYGLSMDGLTALLAMLNSCSPGATVVNVDNGYGAGVAAARIARTVGALRAAAQIAPPAHG